MTLPPTIAPPAFIELPPAALPHFSALIASRDAGTWSELDLIHASFLARVLSEVERLAAELAGQPEVIADRHGTPLLDPRLKVLDLLSRRSMTLTRLLDLHAGARGDREDKTAARKAEAAARQAIAALDAEGSRDLIAR